MSLADTLEQGVYVDAELSDDGQRIEVRFPYDARIVKACKKVPGYRFVPPDKGGPMWRFPVDLTTARGLREQFGTRLRLGEALKEWGRGAVDREREMSDLSIADDAELPNLKAYNAELHDWLRPYQRAGIAMMARTNVINADQPGTGKTIQTIGSIIERGNLEGSHLIVAPKTSLDVVWVEHLEKWTDLPVISMSGDDSPAERKELLDLAKEFHDDEQPFFLVINPAFIRYMKDKEGEPFYVKGKKDYPWKAAYPELFEFTWDTVVFDEYHKMGLSNNKTNMFAAANDLKADHKLLLSGTPMGGKPIKLWGALHFLEPSRFTSKWRWIDEWLTTEEGWGGSKKVEGIRDGKEQEFWDHLKPYMVRRTKAEVLKELPPKQYVEVWCEMTTKQRNQYNIFAADAELRIEEENLTATGILAEYMRLKQFAGAHQTVTQKTVMKDGKPVDKLVVLPTYESGKLAHIVQLLEERGITKNGEDDEGDEQVVIGSQFSAMADMIHKYLTEELGIKCAKITGDTSQVKRGKLVEDFQAGEVRVMVMSTTAGGVAITLDKASTVIIVDETWDPDDQEQLEDRVHRASRLHQVTCYYLRSRDTIEEYIKSVTLGKAITNKEILDLRRQGLRATGLK